jgi:hypothetical protein
MGAATLLVLLAAAGVIGLGIIVAVAAVTRERPRAGAQRRCTVKGCGHYNPDDAQYCARCGARLPE